MTTLSSCCKAAVKPMMFHGYYGGDYCSICESSQYKGEEIGRISKVDQITYTVKDMLCASYLEKDEFVDLISAVGEELIGAPSCSTVSLVSYL